MWGEVMEGPLIEATIVYARDKSEAQEKCPWAKYILEVYDAEGKATYYCCNNKPAFRITIEAVNQIVLQSLRVDGLVAELSIQ